MNPLKCYYYFSLSAQLFHFAGVDHYLFIVYLVFLYTYHCFNPLFSVNNISPCIQIKQCCMFYQFHLKEICSRTLWPVLIRTVCSQFVENNSFWDLLGVPFMFSLCWIPWFLHPMCSLSQICVLVLVEHIF